MHRALQNVNKKSNNKPTRQILRKGGQPIPTRKAGGCGCGKR